MAFSYKSDFFDPHLATLISLLNTFTAAMKNKTTQQQFAAWLAEDEKKSQSELYQDIVSDIQKLYKNKITEAQAHAAARDLIGYCQIVITDSKKQRD